jgi:serine/threonine protein kinase
MTVQTYPETMLYCPKCRAGYKEGAQRFCANDGIRLLPAESQGKSIVSSRGVFTSILNKTSPYQTKKPKNGAQVDSVKAEEKPVSTVFQTTLQSGVSTAAKPVQPKLENKPPAETIKQDEPSKPLPRLIRPSEVASSQAKLGDRSLNPAGRSALTWENTQILIGQTIKGRYRVTEQLSEDELSVAYLAEDKIILDRKAVVRVLMVEKNADDYLNKIFAEERVSLSHLNHPNIAHLFDSGVLPEGNIFIVTEYIKGESLKDKFLNSGGFSPRQTARIIQQAANALSEAHQNGILHRNLKPQNIMLGVSEQGLNLVKVTDFAVYDGFEEQNQENIKYLSPEQLEGKMPTFASDIYSLAVIAYQMLTGRLPFNHPTAKELLKAQKEGLSLRPTNLQLDLPPRVDDILEKALAYKSSDRYPKARDFGDSFYNSLTGGAFREKTEADDFVKAEKFPIISIADLKREETLPAPQREPVIEIEEILMDEAPLDLDVSETVKREEISGFKAKKEIPEIETEKGISEIEIDEIPEFEIEEEIPATEFKKEIKAEKERIIKIPQETNRETPLPETPPAESPTRFIALALGLILLGVGAWAVWNYLAQQQTAPAFVPQNNTDVARVNGGDQNLNAPGNETLQKDEPAQAEAEAPPMPRQITAPPNYSYYQNSKENFNGELAENFRAFSFYYPNDWARGASESNFVDVARIGATGTPIEQMLVSYYDSRGTLAADQEIFPILVQQSHQYFEKQLPNYRLVSQGETKINGEWKAYEMKFRGEGVTKNGEHIKIWGRRLWIPGARQGVKTGFVLTLLATSLSPEVKGVDDVGVKGELATVLETFEPAALDSAF